MPKKAFQSLSVSTFSAGAIAPNPPRRAKLVSSVMKGCVAVALCGNGFYGTGGWKRGAWQLFPTEFGRLCVPLKKSWLRPCKLLASITTLSLKQFVSTVCESPLFVSRHSQ